MTFIDVVLAAIFLLIVIPVLIAVLANEAWAWLPYASRALVRVAVRRLPPGEKRRRYETDWWAELSVIGERRLYAVAWSLDLVRGATVIARRERRRRTIGRTGVFLRATWPLLLRLGIVWNRPEDWPRHAARHHVLKASAFYATVAIAILSICGPVFLLFLSWPLWTLGIPLTVIVVLPILIILRVID
jgi:hypothetical protein